MNSVEELKRQPSRLPMFFDGRCNELPGSRNDEDPGKIYKLRRNLDKKVVVCMIQVAAAIIHRGPRILICQRGAGGNCSNLWEFPGGKVEPKETPEQCVLRECREELGIEIELKELYARTQYRYPDREIAFTFFKAVLLGGEPKRKVHRDIKWVLPGELKGYEFCPADVEIVNRLAMEE